MRKIALLLAAVALTAAAPAAGQTCGAKPHESPVSWEVLAAKFPPKVAVRRAEAPKARRAQLRLPYLEGRYATVDQLLASLDL